MIEPSDITKEKSLGAIWWAYRKNTPERRANRLLYGVPAVLGILHSFLGSQSVGQLLSEIRSLADLSVSFAASILGFLLAGFTIFAVMTKPDLFARMATTKYETGQLSFLKQNFFAFIDAFIVYLSFVTFCFAIHILGAPNGVASTALGQLGGDAMAVKRTVARVVLSVEIASLSYTLVKLKSFIFNVFHIVMTGIRWEVEAKKPSGE